MERVYKVKECVEMMNDRQQPVLTMEEKLVEPQPEVRATQMEELLDD